MIHRYVTFRLPSDVRRRPHGATIKQMTAAGYGEGGVRALLHQHDRRRSAVPTARVAGSRNGTDHSAGPQAAKQPASAGLYGRCPTS
jgi:hypothetical protein